MFLTKLLTERSMTPYITELGTGALEVKTSHAEPVTFMHPVQLLTKTLGWEGTKKKTHG